MSQLLGRVRFAMSLCIVTTLCASMGAQTPEILHYDFNEGSGTTIANNANPGRGDASVTVQGSADWDSPGALGSGALNLMGDGWFDTGWTMDLGPTDDWTLEFHYRSNLVLDQSRQVIFKDAASDWECSIGGDSYGIFVQGVDSASGTFSMQTETVNLRDGAWHHVALVHDSNAPSFSVYVDGNMIDSVATQVRADFGGANLHFGDDPSNSGGRPDGSLDEVRVWSSAMTAAQLYSAAERTLPYAAGLTVGAGTAGYPNSAIAGNSTNVEVASFGLTASGQQEDITSLTVTRTGNLGAGSVTAVRLWHDVNGDALLDGGDMQLDGDMIFTGTTATFTGAPLLSVADGATESLIVTYDLSPAATAGATFGASIALGTGVSTSTGPVTGSFPVAGPTYQVLSRINSLPYTLNFDGAIPANVRVESAAGTYPTASNTGDVPGSNITAFDGRPSLTMGQFRALPPSAPYAFGMDAPEGNGVVALDLFFNLGIYDANTQTIEMTFWRNAVDASEYDYDNVFISTDGGLNWNASALKLDAPGGRDWRRYAVDLSAAVVAAGTNFTATTVVRIQNHEIGGFPTGVLIDDIQVAEVTQGLEVSNTAPNVIGNITSDQEAVYLHRLDLAAHTLDQDINSITVSLTGTVDESEIDALVLFEDDGDGVFSANDENYLDDQTFSGGTLTFSGAPLYSMTKPSGATLYIVAYLNSAAAGATVSTQIAASTDIALATVGPVNGSFPMNSASWTVLTTGSTFPWTEDFEGALAPNVRFSLAKDEVEPRGNGVGATLAPNSSSNNARARIGGTFSRSAPATGAGQLAMDAPYRNASAGMEVHLDLSNQDVALDVVTLDFDWNTEGPFNSSRDGLFISFDGGSTYPWKAWDPDDSSTNPYRAYQSVSINLSQVVLDAAAGLGNPTLNFTDEMVLLFQVRGDGGLNSRVGLLLDNMSIELSARLDVQRPAGTSIGAGATDDIGGGYLTNVQSQLDYTLENLGSATLTFDSPAVSVTNENNVAVTITQPSMGTLGAAGTDTVSFMITPAADGAFSFDFTVASDDLNNPMYTITVTGTSTSFTEIDVQYPVGTSVADGSMIDLGDLGEAIATSYTWTVENSGNVALNFTGVDPDFVAVANEMNATVNVSTQLPSALAAGGSTTFVFEVTPTTLGALSFDLMIASDDADEGMYTVSFIGNGIVAENDIDVQFPAGTSLTAGSTHAIGDWQATSTFMLTYTVANVGNLPLALTGTPVVEISGMVNCTAVVSTVPATTLAAAATSALTFDVTATNAGIFSFDFYIANDDANENPYLIRVAGNAIAAPADIDVARDGTSFMDGGSDDLGDLTVATTVTRTYTITNNGSASLSLTGTPSVVVSGEANCTVSVSAQPALTSLAMGESTTFDVEITPTNAGTPFAFDISIDSNDADEATFNMTIFGNAVGGSSGGDETLGDGGNNCSITGGSSNTWLLLVGLFASMAVLLRRRDA